MKTFKNTLANLAFAVFFASTATNVAAQISASSANGFSSQAKANIENVLVDAAKPVLFETAIIPTPDYEKFQLRFGKKEGVEMTVTLFDAEFRPVYVRKLAKNEKGYFHQNYFVKNLPEGQYQFIVQSGSEKSVEKFEVHADYPRFKLIK